MREILFVREEGKKSFTGIVYGMVMFPGTLRLSGVEGLLLYWLLCGTFFLLLRGSVQFCSSEKCSFVVLAFLGERKKRGHVRFCAINRASLFVHNWP